MTIGNRATITKLHNAIPGPAAHAFNCDEIYAQRFREVRADGGDVVLCAREARKAHDRAVNWTMDSVGLD